MSNELTIKENQHIQYIDQNLQLIQNQNKLTDTDLRNFAIQCKRTGLDPITRQIYAIPNNGALTIMASIDGLRLIAERSGNYEGQTAPQWCGDDGKWVDVWLSKETPKACKLGVYKTKFREPLIAIAIFEEYAGRHQYDDKRNNPPKHKKGDLTFMWAKMPALMIAKVAEALALRKAFPNEMSGIYSTEEMDQAQIEKVQEKEVKPINTATALEGAKIESAQNAAVKAFDFDSYIIQLGPNNRMSGTRLTDHKPDWIQKCIDSNIKWHKENKKNYHANTAEFIEMANAYIESLFIEKEKNGLSEDIPF